MKEFVIKIVKWLATTRFLAFARKIVGPVIFDEIKSRNMELVYYQAPEGSKVIALIKKIKNEQELLISNIEAYQIFMAVKKTAKVNGDIAEVGVYKGGSAKLICEARGEDKALHLFDTFEGLPDLCDMDNPKQFHKGQYMASLENVKTYLKKYSNVYFYKGPFPSTAEPIKNKIFSFVNLDVDLYEPTVSCLDFFYSKMNRGGVIISHDYNCATGVKKAFDVFFEDKPEPIIELAETQCLIVKC